MLILCVDDDYIVRQVTSDMVRHLDHQVIEAHDGESALNLLACSSSPVDVLLTDVRMPGMTGPSLARAVQEAHPGVGIVYMTGYADGISLPGPVLRKPCTLGELENVLEEARRTRLN
jgi:CheY-like chemotaxis protein